MAVTSVLELRSEHPIPLVFGTYHHVLFILAAYLLVILYFGPLFMRNRKPFHLRGIVMAYNLTQIAANIYIIYLCCSLIGPGILDPWGRICDPVTSVNDDMLVDREIMKTLFFYYLNKLFDCLETIFFVLRKKQSQVSFLHVYHHIVMVYSSWISSVIFRDEILIQFSAINTLVHVIMYIYYFLSSIGPSVQKYLWWKKYITSLQIAQFVLVLTMLAKMKLNDCNYTDGVFYMWTFNVSTILGLFVHFYIKSYLIKPKVK